MKKLNMTLEQIAELVEGEVVGDKNIVIKGISGIKEAKEGDITFLANPKYTPLMYKTQASAVIVPKDTKDAPLPIIKTENPSLAFAKIVDLVAPPLSHPQGISSYAYVSSKAKIGKGVSRGHFTIIEDDVEIGEGTIIYGNCFIGCNTKIGRNCLIYSNVCIRERILIGNNVIIHPGTVIGSDGFGFATVGGIQKKIPQIGTVVIEDDVEIGANVTIDRARFDKTVIGKGTKIDNLVQIAHNVEIGENSIIVAQSGISGSTTVGKGVILAGQSGVVGHITIGDNARVAAQAGVTKSVASGEVVSGYPARPHNTAKRINACIQRLPGLYKNVRELQKEIKELEQKLEILKGKLFT